jgi:hypothetical protein
VAQLPALQASLEGQLAAPLTLVHEVVIVPGWQLSQPLFIVAFGA